jgi:hypothetical protein
LGSFNWTHVNDKRVERIQLQHGDQITIGSSKIIFLYEEQKTAIAAEAAVFVSAKELQQTLHRSIEDRGFLGFIKKIPLFSIYTNEEIAELMAVAEPSLKEEARGLWKEANELHLIFAKSFRTVSKKEGEPRETRPGVRPHPQGLEH